MTAEKQKAIDFGKWINHCGWESHPTEEDIWKAAGEELTTEELFSVFESDQNKKHSKK